MKRLDRPLQRPPHHTHAPHGCYQGGAALLMAMLLVTLVAVLSATALWQQWRGIAVETAQRQRIQASWILQGALDWGRLILREDARSTSADHLAEPWAVPLREARLSSFLASGQGQSDTTENLQNAFLSGQVSDVQSKLNLYNLVTDEGKPNAAWVRSFERLFDRLRLPQQELGTLVQQLGAAISATTAANAPLRPNTLEQTAWLGLSPATIAVLRPYATYVPERTLINLNTAPELVLQASVQDLDAAGAQRLVTARAQSHFRTLSDAVQALGAKDSPFQESQHAVNTRYFEVLAQLRLDDTVVQERSLLRRDGLLVRVLKRERVTEPLPASLQ